MPTTNEGLDQVEAVVSSDNSTNNAASSAGSVSADPAPRRRRGGRRVVRGVGAAGASLELKVEEHAKAPLFEEPKLEPVQPARDSADFNDADDAEPSRPRRRRVTRYDDDDEMRDERPRRRRRSSVDVQDEDDRPSRRRRRISDEPRDDRDDRDDYGNRGNRDESSEDRALDAVSALPEGHETRHNPRPMTSLLFQEPILPAAPAGRGSSDDDDADDTGRRGSDDARDSRDDRDDDRPTRRRRRSHDTADTDRTDASNDGRGRDDGNDRNNDAEDDDHGDSRRSRRSRRLNAQERRAAAEVEQIEEDLVLDGITYAPIDDESRNGNDDDDEQPTRTRRRRRGRGNHEEADEQQTSERESRRRHEDDDEEEGTVTRRRRRRRGGSKAEESDETMSRRSRKQQYIDEITDVEGSTRLEAKKQRRRDNRRERSRQNQLMEQDFLARREHVERLMVVRERERHTQISVIEDNVLVEHYVSDIQEVATVGNIYLGRVQNVLPSMEAAFVDIGQARNGVLYAGEVNWDSARLEGQPRRIELAFKSGDPVLVQVTKDPIGHKGARLTSQVTLAGRFLVLVPSGGMTGVSRKLSERERARLKNIVSKIAPKDMGVIIRTAAEGASEEAITKDLENLVRQWERITAKRDEFLHGKRPKLLQGEPDVAIRVVRDIFNDDFSKMIVEGDRVYERIEEYLDTMAPDLKDKLEKWDPAEHDGKDVFDKWQIDSQLRKGMERQVYLPSGGSIVIDRTEAMTTIDVNTGRFIGRGKSLEETVTRCNLEAAEEIARQLRLRDIGGMVMIDFVDMVMPANRDLVLRRLVECLARDRTKHQVAEVTSLGLVQMTRKRIGQGLVEAFSEECPTCKGRGFILHDEPTVSADYDDPYALKGGDPFVKTNKHGHGTDVQVPKGSSPDVKAKLAQIAAAAVAANNADLGEEEQEE
ncbi:Rne/Rng family ribonuclease [Bifidobacterium adolescentis]|nr:Rne/Rng family ribonuclease [Bifidobacterium adolescentis]MDB1485169.1 Rne/Rng family ribonuclease [Bifidobacterium adolescentis]MDB1487506.1 Rne/Rng family ribonuclease [Bifidobacterium adolescentis]MDB1490540.1 Rne/Rng family ribonuclease [Bifidobacterium adolescentis]MDB1499355.1 Rne/Rng family ribonuclease [Bifidobacterium adolescentis]